VRLSLMELGVVEREVYTYAARLIDGIRSKTPKVRGPSSLLRALGEDDTVASVKEDKAYTLRLYVLTATMIWLLDTLLGLMVAVCRQMTVFLIRRRAKGPERAVAKCMVMENGPMPGQ
jgi:hypothetical protein